MPNYKLNVLNPLQKLRAMLVPSQTGSSAPVQSNLLLNKLPFNGATSEVLLC